MDPIAYKGWVWAHKLLNPVWNQHMAHADVAYCAILIAYRAGLREGLARADMVPAEIEYSDFDITDQIRRYEASLAEDYDWPIPEGFPA